MMLSNLDCQNAVNILLLQNGNGSIWILLKITACEFKLAFLKLCVSQGLWFSSDKSGRHLFHPQHETQTPCRTKWLSVSDVKQ